MSDFPETCTSALWHLAFSDRSNSEKLDVPGISLTMVTLGGKVVIDYALRLKRDLGPTPVWVAGYSNDVMAYIPSERVLKVGGYKGAAQ